MFKKHENSKCMINIHHMANPYSHVHFLSFIYMRRHVRDINIESDRKRSNVDFIAAADNWLD